MKNRFTWKNFVTIFLSIFLLCYVGLQIYNSTYSRVKTSSAYMHTVSDSIFSKGIIIRDEIVFDNKNNGALYYTKKNGEKVEKGGVIANSYNSSTDVYTNKKIESLDTEIEIIEKILSIKSSDVSINELDNKILDSIFGMLDVSKKNNNAQYLSKINSFIMASSEKQVGLDNREAFVERLSTLKTQKAELQKQKVKPEFSITAPQSGYFVSTIDGFEDKIKYSDVKNMTVQDYDNIANLSVIDSPNSSKIVQNNRWYITSKISSREAFKLKKGDSIQVKIPQISSGKVNMTIASINQVDTKSDAIIVLMCDIMNEQILSNRYVDIELIVHSYTGLKIDTNSIRIEEVEITKKDDEGNTYKEKAELKGVYVLVGEEIKFRQIIPVYVDDSSTICKVNGNDFVYNKLKLYDEVVIAGKDLYSGKKIR